MRLVVRGRNVEVMPSIRDYAESKLARLADRLPADVMIELELSEETRARHIAEATVFVKGSTIRARESATNLRGSIDKLIGNLERQVTRYQEKRRTEPRRRTAHHDVCPRRRRPHRGVSRRVAAPQRAARLTEAIPCLPAWSVARPSSASSDSARAAA